MKCSEKLKNTEFLELIAWGCSELSRAASEEAQEECERIFDETHELFALRTLFKRTGAGLIRKHANSSCRS